VDTRLKGNLIQFVKFCVVGGSGVFVNLVVFTAVLLVWAAAAGHIHSAADFTEAVRGFVVKKDTEGVPTAAVYLANAAGFVVSVLTNYYLNRRWTFRSSAAVGAELTKFFVVSVVAYLANLAVFSALHSLAHVAPIPSQVIAIACVMPINFVFNKLWSFRAA